MAFVSEDLVRWSVRQLTAWGDSIASQRRPHLWSLLPPKLKGALPGVPLAYAESDDRDFFDRFLKYREGHYPYFDPTSSTWLTDTYWHSNTATFRKGTFVGSWGAAQWDGENLTLAPDYVSTYVNKVLTKRGKQIKIPALALAVWVFKNPKREWSGKLDLFTRIDSLEGLLEMFRSQFHFSDREWPELFDASVEAN